MSRRQKIFRRELLIYPRFQMYLLFINAAVLMGLAGFLAMTVKDTFVRLNRLGLQIHMMPDGPYFTTIQAETEHFFSVLVISLLVAVVISSWLILKSSHKVVGPFLHLHAYFKNIVTRDRAPRKALRFRSTDCFDDLPSTVNSAIEVLRGGVMEEENTMATSVRSRYQR